MKAKRSVAALSVTGIVVVSVVASIDLFSSPGSSSASEQVSGRAEMAVLNSEKAHAAAMPSIKPEAAKQQAQEVARMRIQVEAVEVARRAARKAAQDQSDLKQAAKNAALKRYEALQKTDENSREERASRDAERKKLEGTPKEVAMNLLPDHGWGESQFSCLEKLWNKESRWRVDADNPSSSAYGIPQALPGNRMAAYGSDWRTNPVVQIKWGLDYIENTYGSPCSAWGHSQAKGWY
ncbi:aggregation-promoting factor C-terminal-like domain-containing protein [Kribbella sp. CWNU-51]